MKEEYISFEQAKALFNLDFDWRCRLAFYHRSDMESPRLVQLTVALNERRKDASTAVYDAPTQSLLQRLLREVKGVNIFVAPAYRDDRRVHGFDWSLYDDNGNNPAGRSSLPFASTYEEALSDAIDYALNILKEEQE